MADEHARLGAIADAVDDALAELAERDAVRRVWDRDHTLWQQDPTEVADRLGWLDAPVEVAPQLGRLRELAAEVAADGSTDVVVCGMGGSSLFAEVVASTAPAEGLTVHVLDSTDPRAVRRAGNVAPIDQILFVVASKSGTTVETRSHLAHFWAETREDGRRFVAITDPATTLATFGREHAFRSVLENRPDIGGRYSALSYFGLLPATLAGSDVPGLLDRARSERDACGPTEPAERNPAARLAATLAGAVRAGRDKLTLLVPPEVGALGAWVEQLVAESTGKQGTGVVPVVGEPPGPVEAYGDDRLFVTVGPAPGVEDLADAGHPVVELPLEEVVDIGAAVFRWELATALAGALLRVNPFDQPDVAAAKAATARVLDHGLPDVAEEPIEPLLARVRPGDYVAILAYVDPGAPVVAALGEVQRSLRDRLRVPVTVGIGPRYLHSTGQLHKGGPASGVFLQTVAEDVEDIPIPGEPHGFSTLKRAQAAGDLQALLSRGLRAARVGLDELIAQAGR